MIRGHLEFHPAIPTMTSLMIKVPKHGRSGQRMSNKILFLSFVSSLLVVLFIIASVLSQWHILPLNAATTSSNWTMTHLRVTRSAKCSLEFKPRILPAASDTDAALEDIPLFLRDSLAAVRSAPEPTRRKARLK
jgi:hypothetical protein